MMKQGDYMIYRLYRKDPEDMVTEFFLPDDDMKHKVRRLASLASYKKEGYQVFGIMYVDKECYLNARLTHTVQDYLYMDNQEEDTRRKYHSGEIDKEVALQTLEMIQDHKWTLLKVLSHQVDRLVRNDFSVENEIALQLYDQYVKAML